ncbi:hypothetical protein ASC77_02905 [Nocardioides sp. Root1257]|uniref:hypothetical protein n=1 Tax=unclassified Nocardioides TaxID=2615069 RepID=UPI0006FDD669|nr:MULTISPECIES: hypothetical protein [unclassified Nocardioides]KQW53258.1 hypothetical protein ASC77_02905 [Nocardioides sp. Root1257]KRC55944.1 hypothetical protein ASE24_02905 [Nocardioides sp. Root224]
MSKTDELRAMREAKYARAAAARGGQPQARPKPVPVAPEPAQKASKAAGAPAAETETDGLCGHRSMNGRTCTREAGHAAKSHRYS